jgi:hypothetical protein
LLSTFELSRRHLVAGVLLLPLVGARAATVRTVAEVWKDPNCGCCKDWIAHMEQAGFEVRVHETGNAGARAQFGMPTKFGSCHTARIAGYTIEGHVPAREIQRLLQEKPTAVGLAVPGMVVGSPGMDGPSYGQRKDPYDVILVKADGSSTVFKSYP